MSGRNVLVVGEPEVTAALRDALVALSLGVRTCRPAEAVAALKAEPMAAVAVAPFADGASARFVGHLVQALRPDCPPVVAALGKRPGTQEYDAALRDQCFIAGAADVSVDAAPDDLAARVDAVLHGWVRTPPRRDRQTPVKAQRGRQVLELRPIDLDPTGVGLATVEGLHAGELLRLTLALPGLELVTWGRVAEAEGSPGVRFLGLLAEERARLAAALQSIPRATAPEAPPVAAPSPAPAPAASQGPSEASRAVPRPPPVLRPSPALQAPLVPPAPDAAPGGLPELPTPAVAATPLSAPTPSAPAAALRDAPTPLPPPSLQDDRSATPPPVAAPAPPSSGIANAIGELLGDAPEPAPLPEAPEPAGPASEADVLAALLDSALEHRWPLESYDPAATQTALTMAVSLGLVAEEPGAPPGDLVIEFARDLSPLERRFFEPEPPPEIPDADLARRGLALRLRLLAVQRDGEARLDASGVKLVVDDQAMAALALQADTLLGELQRIVDGFVGTGQLHRIKDVNQFKVSVTRALADVRSVASRLKGEQVAGGGNAALLDVAELVPGMGPPVRREPPKEPDRKPDLPRPSFASGVETTVAQRRRRRLAAMITFIVVGGALAVLTWPRGPQVLTLDTLGNPPGVVSALVQDGGTKARLVVQAGWKPDAAQLARLRAAATQAGIHAIIVTDVENRQVGFSASTQSKLWLSTP